MAKAKGNIIIQNKSEVKKFEEKILAEYVKGATYNQLRKDYGIGTAMLNRILIKHKKGRGRGKPWTEEELIVLNKIQDKTEEKYKIIQEIKELKADLNRNKGSITTKSCEIKKKRMRGRYDS